MILYSLGRNGLPFQSQDDYHALSHFNVCYKDLWPARLCKHELRCLCTMWHFVGTKHFDLFWARFSISGSCYCIKIVIEESIC